MANYKILRSVLAHLSTPLTSLTITALVFSAGISEARAQSSGGTYYTPQPAPLAQPAPNTQPGPFAQPVQPAQAAQPQQLEAWEVEAVGAPSGAAEPKHDLIDGAFQLGVHMFLLQYLNYSVTNSTNSQSMTLDYTDLYWGPTSIPPFIEIGYGLSGHWVLGAILAFGGNNGSREDMDSEDNDRRFDLSIGPKLDFVFSPQSRISPFIGALATIGTGSSGRTVAMNSLSVDTDDFSYTNFTAGGRAGLRFFLFDAVSVDSALALQGWYSSGKDKLPENANSTSEVSGLQFDWTIGLSAWIK